MLRKLLGIVVLVALAGLASAQDSKTLRVEFQKAGNRRVWIQSGPFESEPKDATEVTGKTVELPIKGAPGDRVVYMVDKETGNVAFEKLSSVLPIGFWMVGSDDASAAYAVNISVQHDGKPLSSAVVHYKVGGKDRQSLLAPTDNGKVRLINVPFGPVKVTVEYKSDGKSKTTPAQTFDLAKKRDDPEPTFSVVVADAVDTVAAATGEKGKGGEKGGSETTSAASQGTEKPAEGSNNQARPQGSFLGALATTIFSLAVVGGIVYGLWRYMQANPTKVKDVLDKAGLQVPEPPQDQPLPAIPAQPQPVQKIVLDDATPAPLGAPIAAAAPLAGVPAVANPRLVKDDGSIFLVPDGTSAVGRDDGLPLSLAGDSSVSRRHAELLRTGDDVLVRDLGSTNGTYVNGMRIAQESPLRPGDTVQFGAARYRYEV